MQLKPPVNPPTEGLSKPQAQGPGLLSSMALIHPTTMDADREMLRLWNLVSELTEQMSQNKSVTEKLQSHAGQLQEQAGHVADGATLRRFNTDLSKEIFTTELERLSVALVMENQSLLHENKQLNSLMQEYEQTLETVMTKFRGHCQVAQTHQLTLNRHYETLLSRERDDLPAGNGMESIQIKPLIPLIRRVLRSLAGKDPLHEEQLDREAEARGKLQEREQAEQEEAWGGVEDWAEERETEILRLEQENAQLRYALGISLEQERELGLEDSEQGTPLPSPFSDRSSASRPSSFRDDRGRGSGRLATSPLNNGGALRRTAPHQSVRRPLEDRGALPERVASPPNEVRWEPVVESI